MSLVPSASTPVGALLHAIIVVCVLVCTTLLMVDSKMDPTAGVAILASIGGVSGITGAAAVLKAGA